MITLYYAGKVAWHPLVCFVSETGEWLHARLRNGHAAPSTGARRFLGECLHRLPAATRLFLRADEGFFGKDFLPCLEGEGITYTVGAPLIASVRQRIAEIPAGAWQPSGYREGSEGRASAGGRRLGLWRGASSSAATRSSTENSSRSRAPSGTTGCSSRTTACVRPTSSSPGTWPRPTSRIGSRRRSSASVSTTSPAAASTPTGPTCSCTLTAYNLLTWLKLLALPAGERGSYAKRLRFRLIAVAATVGRSGRRLVLRLQAGYPLLEDFLRAPERIRGLSWAPA